MKRSEKCALLSRDMTLRGLFEIACLEKEKDTALWLEGEEEKSFSYETLHTRSMACAERIIALAFGMVGGFVGLAVDTCKEWPMLFWGLLAAGRQPVLIDPSLADAQMLHLLSQSGANALISRRERDLPQGIAQITPEALLISDAPQSGFSPTWADRIALCTSGTTATSRVYLYDGAAICHQTLGIIEAQKVHYITREARGPMRTLCFLPLNHIFGLMTNAIWLLFLGYPQVYLQDRAAQTILATCRKLGVQCILAVPLLVNNVSVTLARRIANESRAKQAIVSAMTNVSLGLQYIAPNKGLNIGRRLFSSIHENLFGPAMELIVLGGSHAPREHLRRMNALGCSTILGFGMTEVGLTSVEIKSSLKNKLAGSVGWPFPISEYKVRPDGNDQNRGELLIRTKAMHTGRLENGHVLPPDVTEDGYYETGDVVRIGKRGRMMVEGRTKDLILGESGENVYPDELEDIFADMQGVEQLCVLGMKKENSPYDVATLVLSVAERFSDSDYLSHLSEEVQRRNAQLSQIQRIGKVLATCEPMPVVNSIKVKRVALRDLIEKNAIPLRELSARGVLAATLSASAAEQAMATVQVTDLRQKEADDTIHPGDIRDKVRACFADVLEMSQSQIGDDAHFIDDLGGDSLQVLSVALSVESVFDIAVDPEEYVRFVTVHEIAALVEERLRGAAPAAKSVDVEGVRPSVQPIVRVEDMPECQAFAQRLAGLQGIKNPYFVAHDSALMDTSLMEGKTVLNFGSYNYVGMSGRKETKEAAKAAIDTYGTSASGSRLLAGEKNLYLELEAEIADWKHTEAALVLVGGHSTNVTFVGNFCGKDDLILYDALAHNSVQEGCRLSEATCRAFPHNDYRALDAMLRAQRDRYRKVLIVIEGVYSMDGDIAPVREFVQIKKRHGCFLLVDEAHSACVIGKTGGGVDEHFSLEAGDVDIKMGTLSKGLGTCGGYLAGSRALIDYLRYNLPGFVFSVGISPPLAAATLAAIRLLRQEPSIMRSLHRNIRAFLKEAGARKLNTCLAQETAIIPVLVGRDEDAFRLSSALAERGVFVPPAVYPAVPRNKARLRFCVISEHSPEQIVTALDTLVQEAEKLGIALPEKETEKPFVEVDAVAAEAFAM